MKRWMNADEDMKKVMNSIRILIVLFALMFGAVSGAWAQLITDDVEIEVKPSASAGDVSVSTIETREVTLTVTPAENYYIKASDIIVEKLVNIDKANAEVWQSFVNSPIVTTSFEMRTRGIAFFDKARQKQNYLL